MGHRDTARLLDELRKNPNILTDSAALNRCGTELAPTEMRFWKRLAARIRNAEEAPQDNSGWLRFKAFSSFAIWG